MKRETVAYWRRIAIGTLIASGVVLFVFSGATWRTPPSELARGYGISFLFSICIGPLVGAVMPRISPWFWGHLRFPFNWAAVAVVMAALSMVGSAVAIGLLVLFGVIPASEFGGWFRENVRIAIAITLTIGLFITAYEVMRARVAQASAEAQLASLESRVQPHFLFNTLNSIAELIHEDPKGAERMTGQLASLLRSSLDQQSQPLVPLGDELRAVRDYLAIEQVRFGDRLRYQIETDTGAAHMSVPRLALQTLVENSVKFAVTPRREGASIVVRAAAADGRLRVEVVDDGPGFDAGALPAGHGLALLRDRLTLLYDSRATMEIVSGDRGTTVGLTVPLDGRTRSSNEPCASSD
jgi:signal transduction histidine kinase